MIWRSLSDEQVLQEANQYNSIAEIRKLRRSLLNELTKRDLMNRIPQEIRKYKWVVLKEKKLFQSFREETFSKPQLLSLKQISLLDEDSFKYEGLHQNKRLVKTEDSYTFKSDKDIKEQDLKLASSRTLGNKIRDTSNYLGGNNTGKRAVSDANGYYTTNKDLFEHHLLKGYCIGKVFLPLDEVETLLQEFTRQGKSTLEEIKAIDRVLWRFILINRQHPLYQSTIEKYIKPLRPHKAKETNDHSKT